MKNPLKTKLRIRFVLFAMLGLLILQSAIVSISIYQNYRDMAEKSDMLISQLHNNPSGNIRYFSVKIPAGRDSVYPDIVQHISITAEEMCAYAQRALTVNQEKGFLDGYRYHIYRNESGVRIYFLHRTSSIETCRAAAKNLILVSAFGLLGICIFLIPVSGWVVEPLLRNHRRQKQFITAASHELKTPLTVISTNAQLLQAEIGDNHWLTGIREQVTYLTQMTHDLVTLSKAEEYDNPLVRENFSLSDALQDVLADYMGVAAQKQMQIHQTIQPGLTYSGNQKELQQLLRILLDNACKYCPEAGKLQVELKRTIRGVRLTVSNTAEPLENSDTQALLMRFHRGQNADGTKGFGLGLSIAEAITSRHNGHITVSADPKGSFSVAVVLR